MYRWSCPGGTAIRVGWADVIPVRSLSCAIATGTGDGIHIAIGILRIMTIILGMADISRITAPDIMDGITDTGVHGIIILSIRTDIRLPLLPTSQIQYGRGVRAGVNRQLPRVVYVARR